ncbi:conserved hypothetical protein [Roseibium sp. TrichSKD4]|nr:conserved hypothetical protein [Roseibium sp. TrichSKD4]
MHLQYSIARVVSIKLGRTKNAEINLKKFSNCEKNFKKCY